MARQAIPSTRPRLPSPSGRVALVHRALCRCAEPFHHDLTYGGDPWRLAHRRAVRVHKAQSGLPQKCHDITQDREAVCSAPARVSVGKMGTEIAETGSPEHRVRTACATTSASLWPSRARSASKRTPPSTKTLPGPAPVANRCWSKPVPTRMRSSTPPPLSDREILG